MRDAEPRARTPAGTLRGARRDGIAVFCNIPFAKPPFGPRRFAPPEPVERFDGERDATRFGPPPPQTLRILGMSEQPPQPDAPDCLTANVWSPDLGARLPVLVWFYGGGYLFGDAGQPAYDARALARRGVVVVTFNHRVGADGFAYLDGAPANRGLLDQLAALEWVQSTIGAFGGDPGQVTLFGESAGAGSIAALLAMPAARGLFRRAVLQSVPCTFFTSELAGVLARALGAKLGRPPTRDGFVTVSTEDLVAGTAAVIGELPAHLEDWGQVALTISPFSPVVDGDVLPCSPWDAVAAGAASGIELLVGWCREEYQIFHVLDGTFEHADDLDVERVLGALGPAPDPVGAYRRAYPGASPGRLVERVYSDWLFRIGTARLAELHAGLGGRSYAYELALPAPAAGGIFGACHGLDVPLVFGNLSGEGASRLLGDAPSDAVARLSDRMGAAWVRFATEGSPGWAPYGAPRRATRCFDVEDRTLDDPDRASRELWAAHRFAAVGLPTS